MSSRLAMNNDLVLCLQLLEQSADFVQFRLSLQSCAVGKLFLPTPEITGLRFRSIIDGREAQWFAGLLVSKADNGFTLAPGATRHFEWRVRPHNIKPPRVEQHSDYDYYRWCIDVPAGEYVVDYCFEVSADYFDPDSHMHLPDLERLARNDGATVWLGKAESNPLTVIRSPASVSAHNPTEPVIRGSQPPHPQPETASCEEVVSAGIHRIVGTSRN
jgi:hypothetical protein